jgi:hypothetical protein
MAERRRSVRKKSFLRGCVYFNKRRSAIDCLIRDISDQGARIIFSGTTNFPDVVELYIPHKEQTVRAHVQWRRGDEVGLAFPEAAAAPAPLASPQPQSAICNASLNEAEMAGLGGRSLEARASRRRRRRGLTIQHVRRVDAPSAIPAEAVQMEGSATQHIRWVPAFAGTSGRE